MAAAEYVLEKPEINLYRPAMLVDRSYRFRLKVETVRRYQKRELKAPENLRLREQ